MVLTTDKWIGPTQRLSIPLRSSKTVKWFILASHLLALALSCILIEFQSWLALLLPAICWSFWAAFEAYVIQVNKPGVKQLIIDNCGCLLVLANGDEKEARLQPGTFVNPYLAVLCLGAEDGQWFSIILLRDSVDADAFRRLCILLKKLR